MSSVVVAAKATGGTVLFLGVLAAMCWVLETPVGKYLGIVLMVAFVVLVWLLFFAVFSRTIPGTDKWER